MTCFDKFLFWIIFSNSISSQVNQKILQPKNCLVYDVTRRETFTNLSDIWAKEIDLYSTNQDCIKMLVGNKVDKVCLNSEELQ